MKPLNKIYRLTRNTLYDASLLHKYHSATFCLADREDEKIMSKLWTKIFDNLFEIERANLKLQSMQGAKNETTRRNRKAYK